MPSKPSRELLRALIFDFDGVIVDSEPAWDAADRHLVEGSGAHFRPEVKAQVMGLPQDRSMQILLEAHGLDASPPAIAAGRARREAWMTEAYAGGIPLVEGVADLIRGLAARGVALAVGTSTPAPLATLALERHGLAALFPVLVTAEDVPRGKPAPDIFLEAARRLGVPPAACAVLEDSVAGIAAARAAGMLAIWRVNAHAPRAGDEADLRAHDPRTLLETLPLAAPGH